MQPLTLACLQQESELRDQLSTSHYQVQTLQTELAEASTSKGPAVLLEIREANEHPFLAVILEFSEKVSVQEQMISSLTHELAGVRNDLVDIEVSAPRPCIACLSNVGRCSPLISDVERPWRILSPPSGSGPPVGIANLPS